MLHAGFLQLAERTGQGIDRAYRDMLQAGKAPPAIEDSGLSVKATLPGGIGNDAFVRFVRDLPDPLSGDVEVLIALSLLRSSSSIDASKLSRRFREHRHRPKRSSRVSPMTRSGYLNRPAGR